MPERTRYLILEINKEVVVPASDCLECQSSSFQMQGSGSTSWGDQSPLDSFSHLRQNLKRWERACTAVSSRSLDKRSCYRRDRQISQPCTGGYPEVNETLLEQNTSRTYTQRKEMEGARIDFWLKRPSDANKRDLKLSMAPSSTLEDVKAQAHAQYDDRPDAACITVSSSPHLLQHYGTLILDQDNAHLGTGVDSREVDHTLRRAVDPWRAGAEGRHREAYRSL